MGTSSRTTEILPAATAEEAEMAVLGAILQDHSALAAVRATVTEEDFYHERHRAIFSAACDLADYRSEAVDLITVTQELRRRKELDDVGSSAYLAALVDAVPTASNVGHYAGIVAHTAHARRVAKAAFDLYVKASNNEEDWQSFFEGVRIAVEETAPVERPGACQTVGEVLEHVVGELEHGAPPDLIDVPWPGLSKLLCGGLARGELCYIAARPRTGKSAIALEWAKWLADKNKRVLIVSREMSLASLGRRLLAQAGAVVASALRRGKLTADQRDRVKMVAASLVGLPILMASDIETVQAIDRILATQRQKPHVVIVDYLQLLSGRGRDTRERVEGISKGLKALAVRHNLPVICLSSLRRPPADQRDRPPTLSDLKESSNLEHDADVVLLLYRAETKTGILDKRAICTVAKARDAEAGVVPMEFDSLYLRYAEITEQYEHS